MTRTISVIVNRRAFLEAVSWMEWAHRPIGIGPSRIAEFRLDQALVMEAHDAHCQDRPPIRRLRFLEVPKVAARINMLVSGKAEFATDIPPHQIGVTASDRRLEVVGWPINTTRCLVFNMAHPVLASPLVRRAGATRSAARRSSPRCGAAAPACRAGCSGSSTAASTSATSRRPASTRRRRRASCARRATAASRSPHRCLNNNHTNQTATAQIITEGWRSPGLNVPPQVVEDWGRILGGEPHTRGVHDGSAAAVAPDPAAQMPGTRGRGSGPWLRNPWRNEQLGDPAGELETNMDKTRRIAVWRRMLEIIEREDPAYVVLHRNANFIAKRRDIARRLARSFVMDFRAHNWGV
jgi:peptide/nickel transport system substrate-binding protein